MTEAERYAKDRYWLNQDRIPMEAEERYARHTAEVQMFLAEQLEKIATLLEEADSRDHLNFMTNLYAPAP